MEQSKTLTRKGGKQRIDKSVPEGYFDVYAECKWYKDSGDPFYEHQKRIKENYKLWLKGKSQK